jgi:L-asparaginase/Glu-tRNA(Gln) amidotransferase subunit D
MAKQVVPMGLVLTGGTIAPSERGDFLVIDLTDSGTDSGSQLFVKAWDGPERLDLHVRNPLQTLSESMRPTDWLAIAEAIRSLAGQGVNSIVVLHGTDTAGYTAAALSFLLSDLDVTVVVTGAHLPVSDVNSDARTNVKDAISVARTMPAGTYLSFSGIPGNPSEVHLGTTVRNVRNQGQTYGSPNFGAIASVSNGELSLLKDPPRRLQTTCTQAVADDVMFLTIYPGADLDLLADTMISANKRGVIVRLFPSGTGSENNGPDSLLRFVEKCVDHEIFVAMAVEQYAPKSHVYPSRITAEQAGAVFAFDMIPETAYVKLCWALGQESSLDGVRKAFTTVIAGESSVLAEKAHAYF